MLSTRLVTHSFCDYLSYTRHSKKKKKKAKQDGDASESESDEEEEAERQAQLLLEMQRKEADFDVRRYFQSLLSPDTIKMYCFLLATYRDNSARVNHYIHSFFYRIKHFPIYPNEKEWTMQPLLYNIHVLLLFHRMLQDAAIQKQPDFKAFLDFIRGVVRDYFALAQQNHLLFVESLLRQPYAVKSALLLQRNYEPLDSMAKSKSEAIALGREKQIALINEVRRQKRAIDAEELEGEEEFQFTLAPSDFQASSTLAAKRTSGDDASEGEAEFDAAAVAAASAPKPKAKKPRAATSKAGTDRAKNWTKVEDRYLEKMYRMYRHLPSVYEVISYEDMFQDRDRTAEQIERRVKFLKLHRKTHDSSDEEEDAASKSEDSDDEENTHSKPNDSDGDLDLELLARGSAAPHESTRPRRRLRRVSAQSDDDEDSEDDLLQQLVGGRKAVAGGADASAGSHSPDTAANGHDEENDEEVAAAAPTQDVDEDMAEDDADEVETRDGEAQVTEATDSEHATQALESGDASTQVMDDDDETQVADTQMLVDDDDGMEITTAAAADKEEDDATKADSATASTQLLEEDAMEATQDAAEDEATAAVAPAAAADNDDDAPLPPHKRSRDSVADDDSAKDAAASGSPQKKVARAEE